MAARRAGGKESAMCMSCGCNEPHERHGDTRNIVYEDLKRAADASKTSVKQIVSNISRTHATQRPRST
jgi:hypothetical protein